ncbi:MAG: ribosome rescue protein RqcH [Acidilobaceae archaeon]
MARESMSNLDLHVWVKLSNSILGCRIDNVYAIGDNIVFRLRGGASGALLIQPGTRIHLTKRTGMLEKPQGIAYSLRRYLRESKIMSIEQLGFDRVARFTIGSNILYVEVLPRGFIVLTDSNNRIIASSRYASLRDRVIKQGLEYKPPPLQTLNPFALDVDIVAERLQAGVDIVRGLIKGLGLPGEVAEEVTYRSGLKPDIKPDSLSKTDINVIVSELRKLYLESLEGKGYLVLIDDKPVEATPFKPLRFTSHSIIEYTDFNDALDELFSRRIEAIDVELEAEKSRLEKSLREAMEMKGKFEAEAERLKVIAEAIARNYDIVNSIVECVKLNWRSRESNKCMNVVSVDYNNGYYDLTVEGFNIRVFYGETPQDTIIRLYREAGEYIGKAERAQHAIEGVLRDLEELEVKVKARALASKIKTRRVYWFERFRWTITRNSILAIGGRDASQNDSMVRKYLLDNDIFLHADIKGGSAVILKTVRVKPTVDDIRDAAILAACYSKAWKIGYASIDVYWVYGHQVSKSAPPGEYLRTGAFMVYGNRNYLNNVKLELALGVAIDSRGYPIVVVGSKDVVSMYSKVYAIILPGDGTVDEVTDSIREEMASILDKSEKHIALAIRREDIRDKIPGNSRLIKVNRGMGETINLDIFESI